MPMNMERSPRDIAGGYLLLMLAQGDHHADKSVTSPSTKTAKGSNTTNGTFKNHSNTKSPSSNNNNDDWNHQYESTLLRKHPQLELYVANAALQDSILSLTTRHHHSHHYWNPAEIDKSAGRFPPSAFSPSSCSPYKWAQDKTFESKALASSLLTVNKNYHQGLLTTKNIINNNNNSKILVDGRDHSLSLQQRRSSVEQQQQGTTNHAGQSSFSSPMLAAQSPDPSSPADSPLQIPTPTSDKIPLPAWFTNATTTVVIGKGHLPRKTPGNYLLRQLVRDHLQAYQESNRRGRATIVSSIYQTIRSMNPEGKHFGNFSLEGKWQEAKEHAARDKIAATFRDCLCDFYKSSTKSKVAKRRIRKATAESTTTTTTTSARQPSRSSL